MIEPAARPPPSPPPPPPRPPLPPPPHAQMRGSRAWCRRRPPSRCTACTRSHSSLGHLVGGLRAAGKKMPALFQPSHAARRNRAAGPASMAALTAASSEDIQRPEGASCPAAVSSAARSWPSGPPACRIWRTFAPSLGHPLHAGAADADGASGHDGGLACKSVHGCCPFVVTMVSGITRPPGPRPRSRGTRCVPRRRRRREQLHPRGRRHPGTASSTRSHPRRASPRCRPSCARPPRSALRTPGARQLDQRPAGVLVAQTGGMDRHGRHHPLCPAETATRPRTSALRHGRSARV